MGVETKGIGDIPSLSMLQYLDLSNNKEIKAILPPSIQNLSNLTTLALNNNTFSGTIPPSIGNLTNLSWLDLSDNLLSGPIPVSNETSPGLDKLVKAKHLYTLSLIYHVFAIVNNNQLSGTIPSSIGTVKSLEVVRLDSNSLSGTVPQNLSDLKNVNELDMSNNSFDNSDIPTWFTLPSLNTILMEKTQLQGQIPPDIFSPQLESLVLSNNNINGTLDIGDHYSSSLIVDLTNNSITNFLAYPRYNLSLNVDDNPICEAGSIASYCAAPKPHIPTTSPSNGCQPRKCGSFKVYSPNCTCIIPYTGTITFFSHSFSNLDNATYHTTLINTLMSVFRSSKLPVDSISFSDVTINEYNYLLYRLHIFPSSQDYFNRSSVSSIGTVINRQLFNLPLFGPFYFLDESYCCFSGNKLSKRGFIIGYAVGGFVALLLIALAVTYGIYQKRQATKAKKENNPFASWVLDNGNDAGGVPQLQGARWCSFEELKRCTNNFSEDNIVGSGGYGKVYKGTLNTGHVVAIKRAQHGSLQGAHEFKTEIELLSRIYHKNVVALVGFCYEQGEQMLVYEYISNGTLKDILSGEARMRLDWMKRLKIALDSAKGVTYLHELANPPIIHRDIKSNNILLDDHLTAKVADFGLSKLLGDESKGYVSTQVKGTLLLTARSPIMHGKHIVKEVQNAIDKSNGLYTILDPSLGSFQTLGGLAKFIDLAMSCVQVLGADRPKMGEVVREIETIIDLAVLSVGGDSSLTFTSQNTGQVEDLYHSCGDSVSDANGGEPK
ncbi:hypothetical protein L1987_20118 [Smallanthus sonchifolius]|uniref:Uncharacterized protein n=1 Tax=Smallanthus sonchifolius TaxID=185202 RepID=A0ACB9IQY4_9ASTR|nr:hypothetical protein L1987_20118 [Smallanthus sonchifolius]